MNNKSKKKIYFSIIASIIVLSVVVVLATRALWQVTRKQNSINSLNSACLNMTLVEEAGTDISINNMWPTTDQDGSNLKPYIFTVVNECDIPVNYGVYLEEIEKSGYTSDQYLSNTHIKVKLDDLSPKLYSALGTATNDLNQGYTIKETRAIAYKTLGGKQRAEHHLRLWVDYNTPEQDAGASTSNMNRVWFGKIKIIGNEGAGQDCYAVNSNGVLTGYDYMCGKSATIPAEVNGVEVETIASDAFKVSADHIYYVHFPSTHFYYTFEQAENDVKNMDCATDTGTQKCRIDFSIAVNSKVAPLLDGDTPTETITASDIYAIIYNLDPTSPQYSSLSTYVRAYLTGLGQQYGVDTSTSAIYNVNATNLPSYTGISELYFSMEYDNGAWGVSDAKSTSRPLGSAGLRLTIDSLDLSKATNLERIEKVAFSNVPESITRTDLIQIAGEPNFNDAYPDGLSKLKLRNTADSLEIGSAAFAGSSLSSLTIYNSLTYSPDSDDGWVAALGPFGRSSIRNIQVKKVGNSTTYKTLDLNDLFDVVGWSELKNQDDICLDNPLYSFVRTLSGPAIFAENVTFDKNITSIEYTGFIPTNSLVLPSNLLEIGVYGLGNVESLNLALNLPSTLTTIDGCGLASYYPISNSLVIPGSVRTIGNAAFMSYSGDSITFNEGLQSIGRGAFSYYNGSNITLPSTMQSIGDEAFSHMSSGKTITVNRSAEGLIRGNNWNGAAHIVYNP